MSIDRAFDKWFKQDGYWSQKGFTKLQYEIAKESWKQSRIDLAKQSRIDLAKQLWAIMQEDIHRNDQMIKIWNILDSELNKEREDGLRDLS